MPTTLYYLAKGYDVRVAQFGLNLLRSSLARLVEDGIYGNKTVGRVREFQSTSGLQSDGVTGPQTWGALIAAIPNLFALAAASLGHKNRQINYSLGVDSLVCAHKPWPPNGGKTPIEYLLERNDLKSAGFWGRYMNGGRNGLSADEAKQLHSHGFRIMVLYNGKGLGSKAVAQPGKICANDAIQWAIRLSIPKSVYIYANIEERIPNRWLEDWVETLWQHHYGPGIYATSYATTMLCGRTFTLKGDPRLATDVGYLYPISVNQVGCVPNAMHRIKQTRMNLFLAGTSKNGVPVDQCQMLAGRPNTFWCP